MTLQNDEANFLPPLGVGQIIGNTFSTYFNGFLRFFPVGFVIWLTIYSLTFLIYGDLGQSSVDEAGGIKFGKLFTTNLIYTTGSLIFVSMMTLIAVDIQADREPRYLGYFYVALVNLLPLIILQIAFYFGVALGLVLIVVPGLYLLAMWSVYLPAVLIEGAGFRGLNRSAQLTKHYRWAVLVPLAVFLIANLLITLIPITFYLGNIEALTNPKPEDSGWVAVLIYSTVGTIGGGLYAIGTLNIFDRLKEIKEGGGISAEITEVFN